MTKTVILTGASGFVGRSLLRGLEVNCIPTYRSDTNISTNGIHLNLIDSNAVNSSINTISKLQPAAIIHAAGCTPWTGETDYSEDLIMAENITKICNTIKIPYLYFISGWNVYDSEASPPYTEKTRTMPDTDYGKSKLQTEQYFEEHLTSTKLIKLRMSSLYGPGQLSAGLIPNVTKQALMNKSIAIANPDTRRDYLYIDDMVAIFNEVIRADFMQNSTLNVGSGKAVSVREVAKCVKRTCLDELGLTVAINIEKEQVQATPMDNSLSIKKLMIEIGPYQRTEFQVGINNYVKWASDENIF